MWMKWFKALTINIFYSVLAVEATRTKSPIRPLRRQINIGWFDLRLHVDGVEETVQGNGYTSTRGGKGKSNRRNVQETQTPQPVRAPITLYTPTPRPTLEKPSPEPTQKPTPVPPTTEPTFAPISPDPTPPPTTASPTPEPSRKPTNEPTFKPTISPTLSHFPTNEPTTDPSSSPTSQPSRSPSQSPSREPSAAPHPLPSSSPSLFPTLFPSVEPSDIPSSLPSVSPTEIPTMAESNMPSSYPSSSPTDIPSSIPSDLPSWSTSPTGLPSLVPSVPPTNEPTYSPSVSSAPSLVLFSLTAVDDSGNNVREGTGVGMQSECLNGPYDGEDAVSRTFDYSYVALLKEGSNAVDVISDIESLMHKRLGLEFLDCNLLQRRLADASGAAFNPFMLSSLPVDEISPDSGCTSSETQEGYDCYVVDAAFTSRMFQYSSDESVLLEFADWLSDEMPSARLNTANANIHKLEFRGISEGSLFSGIPTADEVTIDPAAAVSQAGSNSTTRKIVGGALAVGVAACAAIVLLFLAMRKRQRNQRYLKQMDEKSIVSLEPPTSEEENPRDASLVDFDDVASDFDIDDLELDPQTEWNHDFETCQSRTCEICQEHKLQMPTFIPADQMTAEIERDLGPSRKRSSKSREYHMFNTVAL